MELRAEPGHGLWLERMQDQITLGREVVVQATEAEVGGPGGLAHGQSLSAVALDERATARTNRDWAASDRLRDELAGRGIAVEDTRDGQRWRRQLEAARG